MRGKLTVEIKSYWHPGTGRGAGSHLDATTHRNAYNLPSLPGRSLKGLVRDAVHRWEWFGGYSELSLTNPSVTDRLFGPYSPNPQGKRNNLDDKSHNTTWPGLLRFSDAQLDNDVAKCLISEPALINGLYRSHFSTTINHDTGTALDESLHGIELIVPLTLYATIDSVPNAKYRDLENTWRELLEPALHLVRAVGAHRSKGMGRAVLTLEGSP